jgi:hypothetical protein
VNGGLLDEVIFAVKTENKEDLAYLDELVPTAHQYSRHDPSPEYTWWDGSWEPVKDPDAIYIKIDDDVVSRCAPGESPGSADAGETRSSSATMRSRPS